MSPPTPSEIATATRPTVSDTRPPSTSRSRTSRPKPSVPNTWPSVPGGSSESRRLCLQGSMAMASGTAYDTRSSRPDSTSAPMPKRSRLTHHPARRSGLEADDGDDREERVPHRVAQDDRAAGEALRPCGADVLEAHHLEERRACEPRDETHAFVAQDDRGQDEPVDTARSGRRKEPEE